MAPTRQQTHRTSGVRASLLAGVLTLLGTGSASAQPTEDARTAAREAFDRGVALMQPGQWAEAAAELERSFALYPSRAALYNVGLCYQAESRPVDALRAFERFLLDYGATAPEAELNEVANLVTELQASVGQLEVHVSVPDAEVRVDDVVAGISPLPMALPVAAGGHIVQVAREGYETLQRVVSVAAGQSLAVNVTLVPAPVEAPVGAGAVDAPIAGEPGGADSEGIGPAAFWTMVGITGAAAVAAGVVGGITLDKDADYVANEDRTAAERDAGQLWAMGTDICIGVAAAAGLTAILLAVWTDWGGEEPAASGSEVAEALPVAPAVSPVAVDGGLGLLLVGRF